MTMGRTPSIDRDQEHDLKTKSLRSEEKRSSTCAQSEVLCFTIVNRQFAYQFGETEKQSVLIPHVATRTPSPLQLVTRTAARMRACACHALTDTVAVTTR